MSAKIRKDKRSGKQKDRFWFGNAGLHSIIYTIRTNTLGLHTIVCELTHANLSLSLINI